MLSATCPLPAPQTRAADPRAVLRRLNVRVIGQGKPPMLLCNGFGCSQQVWDGLLASLAVRHQLIVFDPAGTGAADPAAYDPQRHATLDGYAQDVVEICQALDLRETVLLGHSVGATIGMLAILAAPVHFARAILLTPSPCYVNEPGYHGGFERADILDLLDLIASGPPHWAGPLAQLLMGPTNNVTFQEELAGQFCQMNGAVARQLAELIFLADNRADLPRLRLPTLLVQCAHDVAVPTEVGEYMLRHLPQATLVTLPTGGHFPHLTAPTATLAAIEAFGVVVGPEMPPADFSARGQRQ